MADSALLPAATIARIAQANYPLQGTADHGGSGAFYLADAEHDGIELYRDLPPSEWRYAGDEIIMVSDPVDQEGNLATLTPAEPIPRRAPAGNRPGHLHLQVDDLGKAREFYGRILGFERTASMPGAPFMASAGNT
jgi:catechol 2,3-dioxygenase